MYPTSWTDFFTSFWAAFDGQALSSLASLERAKGSTAFLRALLESRVFLIKRSRTFGEETISEELEIRRQGCRDVASQQCSRVWEELITTHLRVDVGVSGKTLAHTLMSLELINESTHLRLFHMRLYLSSLISSILVCMGSNNFQCYQCLFLFTIWGSKRSFYED